MTVLKTNIIPRQHQDFCLYSKSTNENVENFQNNFGQLLLGLKLLTIFTKKSIRDVRLSPKYTSDIQTFEGETQQKFVSLQNKLLANSFS